MKITLLFKKRMKDELGNGYFLCFFGFGCCSWRGMTSMESSFVSINERICLSIGSLVLKNRCNSEFFPWFFLNVSNIFSFFIGISY